MHKTKKRTKTAQITPPRDQVSGIGATHASRFGALVRGRRKALGMSQDELALVTGVGRRFIIELEGGKPSSQLGRALAVADAVGVRLFDLIEDNDETNALLPDIPDDEDLPS